MKKIILVNGIPASGKSTVARIIADELNLTQLSLDEIKEPFMVQFCDIIDRALNRKLGYAAYQAMFNIVRQAPNNSILILDAWFGFREKTVLQEYLTSCDIKKPIEIWNAISSERVAERYQARMNERIKGHPGDEYLPELISLAHQAQPMRIGECYTVDQDKEINHQELIQWIKTHLD
ncbi:AAA family ATPase [Pectobacterium zantedeschiae]|uniref:AAA family ATPase n=1 Tax=Pectobacterium zantedeschiae TaxID=2034769 RepID=A0A9X8JL64_9GAMM|nr:AAA family ATPase [Pectobacterium zantedeschiae]RYC39595.1 AAA family ATPase [Pectobacterium zantedeschiae]RYC44479.1 AAA family ATPase [Pectobacterium zantedeschiae]RYC49637.1 AAA family ATPase [Pectobacterium zantedeschiae]